jgi:hypothetical protein
MERVKHGYRQAVGNFAHNRPQVGLVQFADGVLICQQGA